VTGAATARPLSLAGWTLSLLDLGAIHAPQTWVFPHGRDDAFAWLPCNALLCRRNGELVLVDTGIGPFVDSFGLQARNVAVEDAVAAAGYSPADVSVVVLTHLDVDHAGGTPGLRGNGLAHAQVVLLDRVRESALDPSRDRTEIELWVESALREGPIDIATVPDGGEVLPGMRLRSAPGHRVGHACVDLADGDERFVHLADVIHHREHVAHPEWDAMHDSDPELALATRRRWIEELAGSGTVVACSHVDGLGRIERGADGGAVWVDVT
jgi:glyoxylase-like metal-dependent hydrolase (beta-lactamase superfamily II)